MCPLGLGWLHKQKLDRGAEEGEGLKRSQGVGRWKSGSPVVQCGPPLLLLSEIYRSSTIYQPFLHRSPRPLLFITFNVGGINHLVKPVSRRDENPMIYTAVPKVAISNPTLLL